MDARQERGLVIAATSKIEKNQLGMWKVPSQSGNGTSYVVSLDHGHPFCSCPDFEKGNVCKHIHAVEFVVKRESKADGTETVTKSVKMTCTQEWTTYNAAQTHEQEKFVTLLRDLCSGIEQPEQTTGRPRLPLSDVVFGLVYKTYTTMSGRRFIPDIKEAREKGLVTKSPSFTSGFRYLENPELTPLLKSLIEESAKPLAAIESDFAVDSTGFATCTYDRWFDHKYGKERSEHRWIKTHLMVGTKTQIVTSVQADATETADAPQLPALINKTAENFNVAEVSADKGYASKNNIRAINAIGAKPYIPFKDFSKGSQGTKKFDDVWHRAWLYYQFNRSEFLAHYHKRSNVETALSMIKAKFGGMVRAKTPVAQINEVLCKILCHNICCLITSMFELGIEPVFGQETAFGTKQAVVPELALK